ncbi:hypothetical protein BLNAU_16521 [Blattamonas nauphoetae]|uniref:Protein kinase domain-containing protein n=1 Tax=Blattamonas nauphoetae TaxID=2049346 RepID=A0ABQ9XE70_9EUKA|nr:hypothetical protein BLNAU_16521 [Blattamonas nauphoetae]
MSDRVRPSHTFPTHIKEEPSSGLSGFDTGETVNLHQTEASLHKSRIDTQESSIKEESSNIHQRADNKSQRFITELVTYIEERISLPIERRFYFGLNHCADILAVFLQFELDELSKTCIFTLAQKYSSPEFRNLKLNSQSRLFNPENRTSKITPIQNEFKSPFTKKIVKTAETMERISRLNQRDARLFEDAGNLRRQRMGHQTEYRSKTVQNLNLSMTSRTNTSPHSHDPRLNKTERQISKNPSFLDSPPMSPTENALTLTQTSVKRCSKGNHRQREQENHPQFRNSLENSVITSFSFTSTELPVPKAQTDDINHKRKKKKKKVRQKDSQQNCTNNTKVNQSEQEENERAKMEEEERYMRRVRELNMEALERLKMFEEDERRQRFLEIEFHKRDESEKDSPREGEESEESEEGTEETVEEERRDESEDQSKEESEVQSEDESESSSEGEETTQSHKSETRTSTSQHTTTDVDVLLCEGEFEFAIISVPHSNSLHNRLHDDASTTLDTNRIEQKLVSSLRRLLAVDPSTELLSHLSTRWIFFDQKDHICIKLGENKKKLEGSLENDSGIQFDGCSVTAAVLRLGIILFEMETRQESFSEENLDSSTFSGVSTSQLDLSLIKAPHIRSLVAQCLSPNPLTRPSLSEISLCLEMKEAFFHLPTGLGSVICLLRHVSEFRMSSIDPSSLSTHPDLLKLSSLLSSEDQPTPTEISSLQSIQPASHPDLPSSHLISILSALKSAGYSHLTSVFASSVITATTITQPQIPIPQHLTKSATSESASWLSSSRVRSFARNDPFFTIRLDGKEPNLEAFLRLMQKEEKTMEGEEERSTSRTFTSVAPILVFDFAVLQDSPPFTFPHSLNMRPFVPEIDDATWQKLETTNSINNRRQQRRTGKAPETQETLNLQKEDKHDYTLLCIVVEDCWMEMGTSWRTFVKDADSGEWMQSRCGATFEIESQSMGNYLNKITCDDGHVRIRQLVYCRTGDS